MNRQEAWAYINGLASLAEVSADPTMTVCNVPTRVLMAVKPPTPDPITGLVPCGCGGKAQIINSSGYSRRLYVECDRCAIMLGVEATGDGALQGIYRYDDQIIKDWNRAMGYREEEGHD